MSAQSAAAQAGALSARSRQSDIFFNDDKQAAQGSNIAETAFDAQPLELEHIIGFTPGTSKLHFHPLVDEKTGKTYMVYGVNSMIVIQDVNDPHDQEFLRGHDEEITSLAVSPGGHFVASGQLASKTWAGKDAPVIIWSFRDKCDIFQLVGIKQRIDELLFSPDERYLAACGGPSEKGSYCLTIWDVSLGEVISSLNYAKKISALCWRDLGLPSRAGVKRKYELSYAVAADVHIGQLAWDVTSQSCGCRSSRARAGAQQRACAPAVVEFPGSALFCSVLLCSALFCSVCHLLLLYPTHHSHTTQTRSRSKAS